MRTCSRVWPRAHTKKRGKEGGKRRRKGKGVKKGTSLRCTHAPLGSSSAMMRSSRGFLLQKVQTAAIMVASTMHPSAAVATETTEAEASVERFCKASKDGSCAPEVAPTTATRTTPITSVAVTTAHINRGSMLFPVAMSGTADSARGAQQRCLKSTEGREKNLLSSCRV